MLTPSRPVSYTLHANGSCCGAMIGTSHSGVPVRASHAFSVSEYSSGSMPAAGCTVMLRVSRIRRVPTTTSAAPQSPVTAG